MYSKSASLADSLLQIKPDLNFTQTANLFSPSTMQTLLHEQSPLETIICFKMLNEVSKLLWEGY